MVTLFYLLGGVLSHAGGRRLILPIGRGKSQLFLSVNKRAARPPACVMSRVRLGEENENEAALRYPSPTMQRSAQQSVGSFACSAASSGTTILQALRLAHRRDCNEPTRAE
jgi:hypothetical protein